MKFVQIYAKLWFNGNILDDFSRKRRRSRKLISHILPLMTIFSQISQFSWKMKKGMFHFKPRLGSVYPSVHVPTGIWWKVIQFIIPVFFLIGTWLWGNKQNAPLLYCSPVPVPRGQDKGGRPGVGLRRKQGFATQFLSALPVPTPPPHLRDANFRQDISAGSEE
jgi:hypothetical protein